MMDSRKDAGEENHDENSFPETNISRYIFLKQMAMIGSNVDLL